MSNEESGIDLSFGEQPTLESISERLVVPENNVASFGRYIRFRDAIAQRLPELQRDRETAQVKCKGISREYYALNGIKRLINFNLSINVMDAAVAYTLSNDPTCFDFRKATLEDCDLLNGLNSDVSIGSKIPTKIIDGKEQVVIQALDSRRAVLETEIGPADSDLTNIEDGISGLEQSQVISREVLETRFGADFLRLEKAYTEIIDRLPRIKRGTGGLQPMGPANELVTVYRGLGTSDQLMGPSLREYSLTPEEVLFLTDELYRLAPEIDLEELALRHSNNEERKHDNPLPDPCCSYSFKKDIARRWGGKDNIVIAVTLPKRWVFDMATLRQRRIDEYNDEIKRREGWNDGSNHYEEGNRRLYRKRSRYEQNNTTDEEALLLGGLPADASVQYI